MSLVPEASWFVCYTITLVSPLCPPHRRSLIGVFLKIVFKNSSVNTFSIFLKYVFEVFSLHLLFLSFHSLCILEDDHEDPSTSPLSSLSIWKYISHQRWTSGDILKIFSFTLHMCEQNSPDTSFIFGSIPFPRQHPSLHIQNYTSHQLYYYFILCFSSFLSSTSFKFRCLCVWLSRIINKRKKKLMLSSSCSVSYERELNIYLN